MTAVDRYTGPIIDSHIHLFDASRAEGIPWPEPGHPLHGVALAADYWPHAEKHGITGAIVVEASHWRLDNFWLLETVRRSPHMLGLSATCRPSTQRFTMT